jgi:DNA-binding beta-propeller fold protein YncE
VSGLQSAFHINHLLEIMEEHKKEKDTAITEATEGVPSGVAVGQQPSHCTEHVDEVLKLYCKTCSEVICCECAIKGLGRHHNHDHETIEVAFGKYKEKISAYLAPMGNQLTRIDQALSDLKACSAKISIQQDSIETGIEEAVRELHKVLETRKTKLLNRYKRSLRLNRIKVLAAQKDRIETTQAQLHSCEGIVRESIKTERLSEVLKMSDDIVHRAEELTAEFPPAFLKPCTEPDMVFSAPCMENYGTISSMSVVNPEKCYATGEGLETAIVGEKSTATVHAISWNGSPCLEPIQSLECELESMLTGARVRGVVEEKGRGLYEISYQPVTKGRCQLHVRVDGLNIQGSPFDVRVFAPLEIPNVPIQIFCDIVWPCGVAFNRQGEIVVSGVRSNDVSIYSPRGKKIMSFGTQGSGPGQFQSPAGVAVDDLDNILVADMDNHRIQKFTSDGRFLASVGTRCDQQLQFNCPMGIAFNTHNKKVYVVDTNNHRIQVSNSDLTFSCVGAGNESGDNGFSYPWGVACDSTGNVYVADSGNNRIQVFTADMQFLRKFGCHGEGDGELSWPAGVAVDSRGMVFVSERDNFRVSVFTTQGRFLASFGKRGKKLGELDSPTSLTVDDCGVLYVCDLGNSRIQMF